MKIFKLLTAITLIAFFSAVPARAQESALTGRLPANCRTAALVKVEKLIASDFYRQLCATFPEFTIVLSMLEAQYQLPVRNIQNLLYFSDDSGRNCGMLLELRDLSEQDFAVRLGKLTSAKPAAASSAIPALPPVESSIGKIGKRTVYYLSTLSPEGDKRTLGVAYLAPSVAVAAEAEALAAYLGAPHLPDASRAALFAAASNPDNVAEFGYLAPPRSERKKQKNNIASSLRQLESFQASCRLGGGAEAVRLDALGALRDEKAVPNTLLTLNGLLFMGVGIFFAEDQPLGDELLNNLSLLPDGRNIAGRFTITQDQLARLLQYSKKRIPQLLLPPDEPMIAAPGKSTP